MPKQVPELHRELLEKEIRGLRPDDRRWVMETFARARADYQSSGVRMVDKMLFQLGDLYELLDGKGDKLSERQALACVAAIKYFLKEGDHIGDDFHKAGLVDDALVIQAAWNEVNGHFQE